VEEIERDYSSVMNFIILDAEENRGMMREFNVTVFPSILIITGSGDAGYLLRRFNGLTSGEILESYVECIINPEDNCDGILGEKGCPSGGSLGEQAQHDCDVFEDHCREKCNEICIEAKNLSWKTTVFCCAERICSQTFDDLCLTPKYADCIQPLLEDYYGCLEECIDRYPQLNITEQQKLRGSCRTICNEIFYSMSYGICRTQAAPIYCRLQGYEDGTFKIRKLSEGSYWGRVSCTGKSNPQPALFVTVRTSKMSYKLGEEVLYSVEVTSEGGSVEGATLFMLVEGPDGALTLPGSETGETGQYGGFMEVGDDTTGGLYQVRVVAIKDGHKTGTGFTTFTVVTEDVIRGELSCSIEIGKETYKLGEPVYFQIKVSSNGRPIEGAFLYIVAETPFGPITFPTASTDNNGYFLSLIDLDELEAPTGTYNLWAVAFKPEYRQSRCVATFVLEPELVAGKLSCKVKSVYHSTGDDRTLIYSVNVDDMEGNPVDGVQVTTFLETPQGSSSLPHGTTSSGYFAASYGLESEGDLSGEYRIWIVAFKEDFEAARCWTGLTVDPDPTPQGALFPQIELGKRIYGVGEEVSFNVIVLDDDVGEDAGAEPVESATVTAIIEGPRHLPMGVDQTDDMGSARYSYRAPGGDDPPGLYTIRVIASKEGFLPGQDVKRFVIYGGSGMQILCPVDVLITDTKGYIEGVLANGTLVREINGAYSFVEEEGDGRYWTFGLPAGTFEVDITGTAEGTFNLITSSRPGIHQDYGDQPISKGQIATIILDPGNPSAPLVMPDGRMVIPTEKVDESTIMLLIISVIIAFRPAYSKQ
jgi:hypothetical protein